MKALIHSCITAASLLCGAVIAAETVTYLNYIRQIQIPKDSTKAPVSYDIWNLEPSGKDLESPLKINPDGSFPTARFELRTIKISPVIMQYPLLSEDTVNVYNCEVEISTIEDRQAEAAEMAISGLPPEGPRASRTRADQTFAVTANNMTESDEATNVRFIRKVRQTPKLITDKTISWELIPAQPAEPTDIITNEPPKNFRSFTYDLNSVPGSNPKKTCREEEYSMIPLSSGEKLASHTIQIWPVADGTISGIQEGQVVKFKLPDLTLALNDLYPSSTTYARVYPDRSQVVWDGRSRYTSGVDESPPVVLDGQEYPKIVPGSAVTITDSTPQGRVLTVKQYDSVFIKDIIWTIELITVTPFGTEVMMTPTGAPAVVTFTLDRTINMNSSISTIE